MLSDFENLAAELGKRLQEKGLKLVTAESCTGGLLSAAITSVPGSSNWFERGFVTYSNESKQELLQVRSETLEKFGAVSEEVAREMAQGALKNSHADIAIAISGIAGPEGSTKEKPVGTIYFAWMQKENTCQTVCKHFSGNRNQIREQAVKFAFKNVLALN